MVFLWEQGEVKIRLSGQSAMLWVESHYQDMQDHVHFLTCLKSKVVGDLKVAKRLNVTLSPPTDGESDCDLGSPNGHYVVYVWFCEPPQPEQPASVMDELPLK